MTKEEAKYFIDLIKEFRDKVGYAFDDGEFDDDLAKYLTEKFKDIKLPNLFQAQQMKDEYK